MVYAACALNKSIMKYIIIIPTILLLTIQSYGQQINYTIEEDNPDNTNLIVGVEPFYIDASKLNFPIGAGISGMYTGSPVQINFVFNRALMDFNKVLLDRVLNTPNENLKPHNALELGIGLPFIRSTKAKSLRVTLSESTSGGYTTTKYISVPGTLKRTIAVRGGLNRYRNSYNSGDFNMESSPGTDQWPDFYSNVTVTSLYMGLALTGITNLRISSTDFNGFRKNAVFNHAYLDLIVAPSVNLGTYTHVPAIGDASNILPAGVYDLNGSFDKSRFGFRLGWQGNRAFQMGKKSRLGLYHRMEAGSRPGIKGGNWYLLLAVGIGINGRI